MKLIIPVLMFFVTIFISCTDEKHSSFNQGIAPDIHLSYIENSISALSSNRGHSHLQSAYDTSFRVVRSTNDFLKKLWKNTLLSNLGTDDENRIKMSLVMLMPFGEVDVSDAFVSKMASTSNLSRIELIRFHLGQVFVPSKYSSELLIELSEKHGKSDRNGEWIPLLIKIFEYSEGNQKARIRNCIFQYSNCCLPFNILDTAVESVIFSKNEKSSISKWKVKGGLTYFDRKKLFNQLMQNKISYEEYTKRTEER